MTDLVSKPNYGDNLVNDKGQASDYFQLYLDDIQRIMNDILVSSGVISVNTQTGIVVLTTANIAELTNLYYTEARVSANTNVAANTAKVTNATHTGDVTGSTALTIAAKAVEVAMLDDGTDGELITWDASGVAATVPVGVATHVLTSNGPGLPPTMQVVPAGGGGDMLASIYDPTAIAADAFARGNHTGTQTASTISDFDTEVSNNSSVTANTAKVTNANHTGDVTGATALTIGAKKVTLGMMADGTDGELFTWDTSGVASKVPVGVLGHVLKSGGPGAVPTFQAEASGGDVTGPAGAVDGNIAAFDTGTGKLLKDSGFAAITNSTYVTTATNATVVPAFNNHMIECTATLTLSINSSATVGNKFVFYVKGTGGDVTIDPDGAELIDGLSTITVFDGNSARIICDGVNFHSTFNTPDNLATFTLPASTTISTFGATLVDDAAAVNARTTLGLAIGTDVQAHSAVLDNTTASYTTAEETKLGGIEALAEVNTVDSVAGKTGVVTLDTDDVTEAANLYYTEARVSANTNVTANTAKVSNATHTGAITGSIATLLGSFTSAQLNTAISDATLSGNNTGDEVAATLTTAGIIEIATVAETNTGTDATRSVSPDGLDGWTGSAQLTTLGTIGTGVWQGTAINQTFLVGQSGTNTGDEVAASTTVSGISELATVAEINTGTDNTRTITPLGLAGSDRVFAKTASTATGGTAIDFTGIPSTAKIIYITFEGLSLSGTENIQFQIGDAGGIETSGYVGTSSFVFPNFPSNQIAFASPTSAFEIIIGLGSRAVTGTLMLTNVNANTWIASLSGSEVTNPATLTLGGSKTLTGMLDRVRIKSSGTNTFDATLVNVLFM